MDRPISKEKRLARQLLRYLPVVGVAAVLMLAFLFSDGESRLDIERDRLIISEVTRGPFQLFIPVTGTVMPIKMIYLDAVEGGRVAQIFREAGSYVEAGDSILQLTNTDLLLDVMNREAVLFEQVNNLRNTRLAMERNSLELETDLAEIRHAKRQADRTFEQNQVLWERRLISREEFDLSREDYEYQDRRLELTKKTRKQDSTFRALQVDILEASVQRLQNNLEVVRRNLQSLIVRAPQQGMLTSLDAEIGESKSRGDRLGRIDNMDGYKVGAEVDEHYISQVNVGMTARLEIEDTTAILRAVKIYPEVTDGRFQIDFEFVDQPPHDIRRGQSLHLRVAVGAAAQAIQLPRGGFFNDTGGHWAFVLDESGERAERRQIQLGRQNPETFEVIDGLRPGEKVITSSYTSFKDVDKLVLNK